MAKKQNRYSDWQNQYTFETCKLDRGNYGEFLKNYIVGEHEGFVLNLNGKWGTGKTEFLKRFYSLLSNDKYPVVYVDAWESDFSSKPLSVVSSELLIQISTLNENVGGELAKVGEVLGKLMRGVFIGSAGYVSKKLTGEASYGSDFAKELLNKTPSEVIDCVKNEHAEQVAAIRDVRLQLALLAEVLKQNAGYKLPVVVLIDELDRCRPTYSIEMLEVVKHFFSTENFVFVIATDTEQLKESIKTVYGAGFDSSTYLKRFFHREAKISEPSIEKYLSTFKLNLKEYEKSVALYPKNNGCEIDETAKLYMFWIFKAFNLTLRDIEQIIGKFLACIRTADAAAKKTGKCQLVNCFSLISALVEFDKGIYSYENTLRSSSVMNQFYTSFIVDAEHKIEFSEVYNLSSHCTIKHKVHDESYENYSDNYIDVYGTHQLSGVNASSGSSGVLGEHYVSLREMFEYAKQTRFFRVWLWEDFESVVKLSGEIS